MQLLSEEYKKATENDEQRNRRREERRQKKLAEKQAKSIAKGKSKPKHTEHAEDESSNGPVIQSEHPEPAQVPEVKPKDPASALMLDQEDGEESKERPTNAPAGEVKIEDLLAVPGPKYEEPLPPLQADEQLEQREVLHHITTDEMMASSLGSSLPFSMPSSSQDGGSVHEAEEEKKVQVSGKSKGEINVIDYNGTGKETVSEHHLSMDNEELVSEKESISKPQPEELKEPEETVPVANADGVSQEILAPGRNARHTRRQCNSALCQLRDRAVAATARNEDSSAKQASASFCSAREPAVKSNNRFIRRFRGKPRTEADKCNKSEILPHPDRSAINAADTGQKSPMNNPQRRILETRPADSMLLRREEKSGGFHCSNSISINGMRTINTLTKGYQATGECSTSFTGEPLRPVAGKRVQGPVCGKLDQAFLAQMVEECKGTDNLTLSSAGVLFGAAPLSGYVNLPTRGTMFQSFSANKPTLPLGLCTNNAKQGTGGSTSITIKRLGEDSADCSGLFRIRKKFVVPIGQSPDLVPKSAKVQLVLQDESGEARKLFKRIKVRKAPA